MIRRTPRRGVLGIAAIIALNGCSASPTPAPSAAPTPAPTHGTPTQETPTITGVITGVITVDPPEALIDEPVSIRLSGFAPDTRVTVRATTVGLAYPDLSPTGIARESAATFVTDADGAVDLARQAPLDGSSYGIANPMGLFWSMAAVGSPTSAVTVEAPPTTPNDGAFRQYRYQLDAVVDGAVVSTATLDQDLGSPNVTMRDVAEDGVIGQFYLPPGPGPFPGVIVLAGTSGGITMRRPKVFAAHGFAALSLPYTKYPGVPDALDSIPLEYFTRAIAWLQSQPGVDPSRIGIYGLSYGGTVALEVTARDPAVKAVVAVSPPTITWAGDLGNSSLTWKGKPIASIDPLTAERFTGPARTALASGDAAEELATAIAAMKADPEIAAATIPVERAHASILFVTGTVDSQIPGPVYAELAMDRLRAHDYGYPYRHLLNAGAGHLPDHPYVDRSAEIDSGGGDPEANELAGEAMWPAVLESLAAMK